MNLPFYIAKRYLFSKKSLNIINVITSMSVLGIAFSTAAMVIVLSAFNGIEGIVEDLYSTFDADIKITLKEGKTFRERDIPLKNLQEIEGVKFVSPAIEETVLFKKGEKFVTAKIKGVSPVFVEMVRLDTLLSEGYPNLTEANVEYCIPGIVLQSRLGVSSDPRYENVISANGMLRTKKITMTSTPFNTKNIQVGGVFSTGTPNDEKYILTSLNFAKKLLEYTDEYTTIEIGVTDIDRVNLIKNKIIDLVGDSYIVKTKIEQNQLIFSATRNEKIATYIILAFVLLIAAFTLIASLTMLILEKQKDVRTLFSMGFSKNNIEKLFFYEGLLINFLGGFIGVTFGVLVCYLQIWFQFIPMEGMIVDAYPIEVEALDLVFIVLTVLLIGLASSYFPVKYLVKKLQIS